MIGIGEYQGFFKIYLPSYILNVYDRFKGHHRGEECQAHGSSIMADMSKSCWVSGTRHLCGPTYCVNLSRIYCNLHTSQ